MKKFILACLFTISGMVFAHAPVLSVDDNKDGTVYIEAGFSNGEKAEGLEVIIVKDKPYNGPEDTYEGKMIIFKGKFGSKSSMTVIKPLTPKYEVIFNGGPGHIISKKGPKLEESEMSKWKENIEKSDSLGEWKEKMTQK
ncbi:hypothetical protein EII29_02965 [Leptotrichia sp. OH3620_COT-345]|uniref:hypothetical protein n=1 Tax=Leptotrichia sp. OH3620_COT-345 TaxID=2491048 RepID=UPI000F64F0B1|nr:hypothetical protein [Leptotrichia sp. OH3620_COT-345]RRD40453.1 hypothetical protein EII29_02965 [Leptotrichia sp. OH3620_COT-345]